MRRKKILVNAYFAQNLGDDLFLKVLIERYPNALFHLLTANGNYNRIFKDYKNVKILKTLNLKIGKKNINLFNKIHEELLHYRNYDALVIIGGSIFMESPNWRENLCERKRMPIKFKNYGKKTFILGANFGPYTYPDFVEEHSKFFSLFDDICFRDRYSYNLFKNLNNVRIASDIVFNLRGSKYEAREKCVAFSIIDIEKRIGLKEYSNGYFQKIKETVISYIKMGYKVKFFSFCEKEGDLKAINRVMENLEEKYQQEVSIVQYQTEIERFLIEFQSCEIVIGTRFHSIILGLLFDQIIFPIIYSEKTFNVLKDINMHNRYCYIQEINDLDVNNLVTNTFNNKLKNRELISGAYKQFEKLDLFLA